MCRPYTVFKNRDFKCLLFDTNETLRHFCGAQVVIAHTVYVPAYTAFKKYVWKTLRWWHWGADQVKATCPIYE